MEFFISKYTDKGGRPHNEDSIGISEDSFVVADGLGGHDSGEVASKMAVDYVLDIASNITDVSDETMHRIIDGVNKTVYNGRIGNMATTVVAAFIKNNLFNYLNVGDSRMYYFRKGKIFLQSKDHSITQLCVDMGEISPKEMRFHEDRNRLTKALGLDSEINIPGQFAPFEIEPGDAFLLCSDGFWEYVYEKEMVKYLQKSDTPQKWMEMMLNKVLKRVKAGNDNMSAVCVFIK
ncbi:MAG: PP2C family protein-serine/threonine phosphatase [Butyrivibrio sp.]